MVSTESSSDQSLARNKPSSKKNREHHIRDHHNYSNTHYDLPRSIFQNDNVYDVVDDSLYMNVDSPGAGFYQNVGDLANPQIYDQPRSTAFVQSHYENMNFDEDHTYLNLSSKSAKRQSKQKTYDVPKAIYEEPQQLQEGQYDSPKNLMPLSATLLLSARNHKILPENPDDDEMCDADSLEGDSSESSHHGNLMSAQDSESLYAESRSAGASSDEGIGELDIKGLEIIVEEAEEDLSLPYPIKLHEQKCNSDEIYANAQVITENPSQEPSQQPPVEVREEVVQHSQAVNEEHQQQQQSAEIKRKNKRADDGKEESPDKTQKDRCIEVYHETLRQRNSTKNKSGVKDLVPFHATGVKEDVNNLSTIRRMKKLLPSVKALRNQFESKNSSTSEKTSSAVRKWKSTTNFHDNGEAEQSRSRSSSMGSLDEISSTTSSNKYSSPSPVDSAASPAPIIEQFETNNYDLYKPRHSTAQWDPTQLLKILHRIEDPLTTRSSDKGKTECTNLEGYLDKLPSGRKKATFWNAWKRRYFKLKDGYLYYYQNNLSEKPNLVLQLIGGKAENMDNNMIGIDDGKGHYMVIRGTSEDETAKWYEAVLTHLDYSASATYVQPWPIPKEPALLKDVIVLDLGSCSIRAGILSTQPTLPHVFFPSVAAADKHNGQFIAFGSQALLPENRAKSSMVYPLKPSNKISKFMMDMQGVAGLIRTAFRQLNVDPSNYSVQVSIPRHLNTATQVELLKILFDDMKVQAVNLVHQSILSLLSYNATSGIVVDIGERIDIVPVMDGYILQSGVSQVPYGGQQLMDHMRHFLVQQKCSLITDVESYLIRYVLEKMAYVAGPDAAAYSRELAKAKNDPVSIRATIDLTNVSNGQLPWESISLDLGRFQVSEGLFHPEAWGLDNEGVPKLIYKAIQDCSMDIRKEMARSIYLSGGVTLLSGFPERLEAELDRLTPKHLIPKVNASPYRYHSAYVGGCVHANSGMFDQSCVTRDEWSKSGHNVVRRWKI